MRVLILGATGMLGSTLFRILQENKTFEVWGTLRDKSGLNYFSRQNHAKLISNVDILDENALLQTFEQVQPNIVINCIGVIKQLEAAQDPLVVLPINALLPHRLATLCKQFETRLVHISTDCVFSGKKGSYTELDQLDAQDLYGQSKYIGELTKAPHAITLRTSMIGHELNTNNSLVDWFLSQQGETRGYMKAIFSGLPTVELAQVIENFVIPNRELSGLYHVAAKPINKYELLRLVAEIYGKNIVIIPDEELHIDRSLNAQKFTEASGYVAPEWPQLIEKMHQYYTKYRE